MGNKIFIFIIIIILYFFFSFIARIIKMSNEIRQNFSEDVELAINNQINMELFASYTYLAMAYHFNRHDVALKGFYHFFKKSSDDEREHAMKLLEYMNKRGGKVILRDIVAPGTQWNTAEEAVAAALQLEKDVNRSLLNLHGIASAQGDANMCDFIENEYLQEQVDSIKEIGDLLTNCRRVGEGLGIFILDKELHESKD
jgi:ferritin heavy chain